MVVWNDQALTVLPKGCLRLPTGGQRPPVLLPLPAEYQQATLRRAELTWRAAHYQRCSTLDSGETLPPPVAAGAVAEQSPSSRRAVAEQAPEWTWARSTSRR
jgi:hypothetical protein